MATVEEAATVAATRVGGATAAPAVTVEAVVAAGQVGSVAGSAAREGAAARPAGSVRREARRTRGHLFWGWCC